MQWFRDLFNFIISFFPKLMIIPPHQAGVMLTLGRIKKDLPSGWYIWWPIIHDIYVTDIKPQIQELGEQSITLNNGKSYVFQTAIEYEIFDQRRAMFEVNDFTETLYNLTRSIVYEEIEGLLGSSNKINLAYAAQEIKKKVGRKARKWGIKVTNIWFTTYADHKVIRLLTESTANTNGIITALL